MPKPRVNHSRETPSAHPTMSLALLVQVGAVAGPPGACSIIGHHPGALLRPSEYADLANPRDAGNGALSNSVSVWLSAFGRTRLPAWNWIASIELDDDSLARNVRK